ncbi:MAG: hypothetical protein JW892_01475 [Anaerolineae bacterium]|nr:hypothetical protein [Anaerolineae bacterium]
MSYEILEETPYGGKIHVLTTVDDLNELSLTGRKLLTLYQGEQFRDFPTALLALAEKSELPWVAVWLRDLAEAQTCHLEVCLTEYAAPQVFLRYPMTEKWAPALSFQAIHELPYETPALLRQVYALIGGINFEGYGYAGGLLCPPDPYPDLGSYDEWRDEDMPDYDGFMAFYETWTGDKLLVNSEGEVGWFVHDDSAKCRLIGALEAVLPALFAALGENRPFEP